MKPSLEAAQLLIPSFTHLVVNEVFAAPASFLSVACALQESVTHFFMKLVLAAPASFLSVAWVEQEFLRVGERRRPGDGENERGERERLGHGSISRIGPPLRPQSDHNRADARWREGVRDQLRRLGSRV